METRESIQVLAPAYILIKDATSILYALGSTNSSVAHAAVIPTFDNVTWPAMAQVLVNNAPVLKDLKFDSFMFGFETETGIWDDATTSRAPTTEQALAFAWLPQIVRLSLGTWRMRQEPFQLILDQLPMLEGLHLRRTEVRHDDVEFMSAESDSLTRLRVDGKRFLVEEFLTPRLTVLEYPHLYFPGSVSRLLAMIRPQRDALPCLQSITLPHLNSWDEFSEGRVLGVDEIFGL